MYIIIFEHVWDDINLICKEKTKQTTDVIKRRLFEDARKQLEKFSLNFSSFNHFHPGHLQPKTLANSFNVLM